MRRQITSFSLVLCGLCLIFGSLLSLVNTPVASAMPVLAPSPRPPVDRPSDDPPPDDPSTPDQPGDDDNDDSRSSVRQTAATGRITGTIIDATTGAPVPGITVNVGGVTVTSDANGNYDHWLPVGTYSVGLVLANQQGTDLQGPRSVEVRAGDTTVQHLYYLSQPALPAATAVPAPTTSTAAQPAAPVDTLPNTGVAHTDAASDEAAPPVLQPQHLPRTSIPADSSVMWLALGASLVLLGTLVGWSGRFANRRSASASSVMPAPRTDNSDALLAALLAVHPRHSSPDNDTLLVALLDEHVRK